MTLDTPQMTTDDALLLSNRRCCVGTRSQSWFFAFCHANEYFTPGSGFPLVTLQKHRMPIVSIEWDLAHSHGELLDYSWVLH